MQKYREVSKRITGLLLAVCMFATLFCDVPVRAAEPGTGDSLSGAEITLYTDEAMRRQVTNSSYTYDGNAKEPYVKVTYNGNVLTEGEDYTKSYTNNVNAGDNTAAVTIKGTAEGAFDFDSTKSKTFTIQKMRFSSLAVTYTEENLYDGGAYPRPAVTSVIGISSTGQRTLTSGEYTLEYTDATGIGVDKGYFQVNLSNNYSCTTNPARYYSVYRDLSSENNISVIWQETSTFTGSAQTPAFSVYDNNTRGTVSASNYVLDWNNNLNAGTGTLTLSGDGDYRGEKTATFNIEAASINNTTITFEPTNVFEYTGSTIDVKNSLVVMLGSYRVPATNYTVSYGPNYSGAKIGPTTAYITGINNLKDEATALFSIRKKLATAVITSPTYTYTASPIVPDITVTDTTNTVVTAENYSIKYFPTNAYAEGTGSDTAPTTVGTYYVQITGLSANNHTGTLGDRDNPIGFSIIEKQIGDTNIFLNDAPFTDSSDPSLYYTGATIKPSVKVREGVTDLTAGVDYDIEYYTTAACTTIISNPMDVGTYYIKLTGKGSYAGSEKVLHYNIAAQQIAASNIAVTADDMMYTGTAITPTNIKVVATIGGSDVEMPSGSYSVSCTNNTAIGTATITITLTGNYTGTTSGTFEITPKSLNGCAKNYETNDSILNVIYNGSSQKPFDNANGNTNITFRDGNYTLRQGIDYTINCYSASSDVSLPDGIENAGTCRVIVEGIGNYADGTKLTLTFTVQPKSVSSGDITYTVNKPEYNATGTLSGVVTAHDNTRDRALVLGTDYTIAYYKDAACTQAYGGYATAGVLYAQVRGMGNYTGTTVPEPCTIGTDINDAVRSALVNSDRLTYNGASLYNEINNNIVVINNEDGSELARGTDYSVTYYTDATYTRTIAPSDDENAVFINAGTVYYTINGLAGYFGSYKANVKINPKSIAGLDAVINGTYSYNGGSAIKPLIQDELYVTEGIVLTDWNHNSSMYALTGDDYEIVTYANNTIVTDAATVTVRGKGNYIGSRVLTFRIVGMNLSDMLTNYSLTASAAETVFNGMDQAATVTARYTRNSSTVTMRQGADFTVEYYSDSMCTVKTTDMKSAGTRYIKLTGAGNYQGSVVSADTGCVFTINKRNINDVTCTLEDKTYYYSDITTSDKIPAFIARLITSGNEYTLTVNDYTYEKTAVVDLIGPQSIVLRAKDTGNFTGTKTVYFAYMGDLGKDIAVSGINESYEIDNYTSGLVEPTPTIKNKADGEVIPNSNFDIKYTNSNVVGEATITITPATTTQYWTGTYEYKYKIKGDIKNAEVTIPTQLYTGEAIENLAGMTVICNGFPLVLGRDYEIRSYTNNTNAALATSAAAPSVTIAGIGTYFDGHSESVKTQTFDIKYDVTKATIEATTNKLWTGSEVTLDDLVVAYNTAPLVNGVDYTVNYYNNVNVSPMNGKTGPYAEIVPTADGLLTGDPVPIYFSIGQVDITLGSIDGVADSYIYSNTSNKNPIKPSTMTVKLADGAVIDPTNYAATYSVTTADGTDPDVAAIETITVRGINNYSGTLTKTIEVMKRNLGDANQATVVFTETANRIYDGLTQEPPFKITYLDYEGVEQTLSTSDYTVESWNNNTNAGVADGRKGPYVVITTDGTNCKNSVTVPFTIEPMDVAVLYYAPEEIADQVYQAGVNHYTPALTVKLNKNAKDALISNLVAAEDTTGATRADYTISYRNNTGVMEADLVNPENGPNILIEARSSNKNFTGSYMIPFAITSRSLEIEDEETKDFIVDITLTDPNNDKFNTLEYNYPFDKDNPTAAYEPVPVVNDRNKAGELVELTVDRDYTISYVNNNAVGTAQVVITGIGNYSGTRTIDFTIGTLLRDEVVGGIYPATIVIESNILDGNTVITYDGQAHKLEDDLTIFECINGNKNGDNILTQGDPGTDCDYSIKYYSNPECTIETNCIHAGTVYAKITGEAAGGYVGTLIKEYTIERKSILSEDVVVDGDNILADMYFNGSSVVPKPTIMDMGIMAPTGVRINNDCVLTYEHNSGYGTATLVITGGENGNYIGTKRVHFEILRQDIANATIDRIPNQIYTGKQIMPGLVVTYNGNVLQAGRDYQLTYGNNTYAGIYDTLTYPSEAWIAIQGVGNYTGKVEKYFNIFADLKDATVQTITTQAYTGSAVRPAVSVRCGGNILIANTDYTVEYTNNIAIGEATITIRPTASSCYTGTKVVKFYIGNSLATATVSNLPTAQTYTGRAIVPEPVVKIGNTTLRKGTDYSVQWRDNIKAGTASVVVTGIGTYAGSKTVNYRIITKGITRCSVSSIADITYDGKSHSPKLVVKDGKKVLAQGTDYTLTNYRNNRLPGTATFRLTGIGNYSGSTTIKFNIIVAKMASLKATPGSTSIKLSWKSRSNVTGYQVYTSDCRTRLAQIKTTSRTISKLAAGKNYTYKVRTYLKVGSRTYYGAFATIKSTTKPSTVTLKSVKSNKTRQAAISWSRVNNAAGYEVYRSTSKNGKYARVATLTSKSRVSYTNTKLTKGRTYYYKVRAYRSINGTKVYGSYSKVLSVKVK